MWSGFVLEKNPLGLEIKMEVVFTQTLFLSKLFAKLFDCIPINNFVEERKSFFESVI